MSTGDNRIYPVQHPITPEIKLARKLKIQAIDGIKPLKETFGLTGPLTLPAMLQNALFGPPERATVEAEGTEGDLFAAYLHTYAILDAARCPALPDILAASHLEYRCLFKGEAFDKLNAVAPWVVRLEKGHRFTHDMFTEGDEPWNMWGREVGIIFRSPASFERIYAHARRKIRVLDTNDKAFYLRFWDPFVITVFLSTSAATTHDKRWLLSDHDGVVMSEIFCITTDKSLHISAPAEIGASHHGFKLSEPLRAAFAAAVTARKRARDIAAVQTIYPETPVDLLIQEREHLLKLRFHRSGPIRAALCLCAYRQKNILDLPDTEREIISSSRQSDLTRIKLLRRVVGDWPMPKEGHTP